MNKTDLIDKVAVNIDISRTSAAHIIEDVLENITNSLRNGDTVRLSGFGTFSVSNRAERIGRNPKTGERITSPPRVTRALRLVKA
jgi:nucleoid DNA-binding protein